MSYNALVRVEPYNGYKWERAKPKSQYHQSNSSVWSSMSRTSCPFIILFCLAATAFLTSSVKDVGPQEAMPMHPGNSKADSRSFGRNGRWFETVQAGLARLSEVWSLALQSIERTVALSTHLALRFRVSESPASLLSALDSICRPYCPSTPVT